MIKELILKIKDSGDWIEGVPNKIYRLKSNIRYCLSINKDSAILTNPDNSTEYIILNNKEVGNLWNRLIS